VKGERRPLVLTDGDVDALVTPEVAVLAARASLRAAWNGTLHAPSRRRLTLGSRTVLLSAGALDSGPIGFRAYGLWDRNEDEVTAVWDDAGSLSALIVGRALGAYRTGALGGVAIDLLAPETAKKVAVIGTGLQAWTQLWAAQSVRRIAHVQVAARTLRHSEDFAERARTEFGLDARAARHVEAAVRGADIVICATTATEPVLELEWLAAGAHITTLGSKLRSGAEIPAELTYKAAVVATDAPAEASELADSFFTERPVTHLGAIEAGDLPGRASERELTIYCSLGLAGSEVLLAKTLLDRQARC